MRKLITVFLGLSILFLFTSCFNEKNSPFYDSEWIMQNVDSEGNPYYHHLILSPGRKVMLRISYFDSTNIIVWTGTYKINSRKFNFNFTDCVRYEDGKVVGQYTDTRLIKYYAGEYFYSVGLIGDDEENKKYHMQLIRPNGAFYDKSTDIYGNELEDFIKTEKLGQE